MHFRLLLYMVQISAFTQIFHVHSHELDVNRLVLNDWCITSLALQMVSLIISHKSYSTCGHIVIFLLVMFVVYSPQFTIDYMNLTKGHAVTATK
jgi:hypothetical protein